MRKKTLILLSLLIVGTGVIAVFATAVQPTKKATLVIIPAQFEVKAPVSKVWSTLITAEGFGSLTGFKPDAASAGKTFSKVGDNYTATIWSDKGRLVATQVTPNKELRVAWEVENGNYLCHKRIILKAAGDTTNVEYWDRYTDDQTSVDKTADDVAKQTETAVTTFTNRVQSGT